jgi:hypothetical protein
MFTWHYLIFLWILAAFFFAGFGWKVGTWLAEKIFK